MPKINVEKGFTLQLGPAERDDPAGPLKLTFAPGIHQVSDAVASHWYTKLHLAKGLGTAEYAAAARAAANTARQRLDAAQADFDRLETAAQAADAALSPEAAPEPAPVVAPDQFDAMSDDELRAHLKERDGRTPHPNTGRDKLLAKARAAAGDPAEEEPEAEADPAAPTEPQPEA